MRIAFGVLVAAAFLFTGCGNDSSDTTCNLTGTISTSGVTVSAGDAVSFTLDTDTDALNGVAKSMQFNWPGGSSAAYAIDISGLAAGSYYYLMSVPAASAVALGGPTSVGCGTVLDLTLTPALAN